MLDPRLLNPATILLLRAARARRLLTRIRPGAVLAVAVISVVGLVGIFEWDQRLIVTGFIAGMMIVAINIVVVTTQHWHRRNTQPEIIYPSAEEVVRRRTPQRR